MDEAELDLYEEVERGHKAGVLIEGLEPYLLAMEAQIIEGICTCSISDIETLKTLKLQHHALRHLRLNIQSVMDTGKLAAAALNTGK